MPQRFAQPLEHPRVNRRCALQAGAVGLLGLGMNHLTALRGAAAASPTAGAVVRQQSQTTATSATARSVIYIFLSGGLSQHDSFDLKPNAPDGVRGEFQPIATRTPGIQICEHLPMLAKRSHLWALVRSLTHPYNDHSQGHMVMLSGQTPLPPAFSGIMPKSTDWPSIAAVAGVATRPRNNLPPAVVLPERLIHRTGRVIPGQFAGMMGSQRDPWFVEACRFNPQSYGAYPEYGFHLERGGENPQGYTFQAPNLALPEGLARDRLRQRLDLLARTWAGSSDCSIGWRRMNPSTAIGRTRFRCWPTRRCSQAFDVVHADAKVLDRYGRNSFGWSLLMARRLVEAGVNLVQVNLGNNETWDTHAAQFPVLRDFAFPPTDRALSALLDDLDD